MALLVSPTFSPKKIGGFVAVVVAVVVAAAVVVAVGGEAEPVHPEKPEEPDWTIPRAFVEARPSLDLLAASSTVAAVAAGARLG